jgi:hypothetical protein
VILVTDLRQGDPEGEAEFDGVPECRHVTSTQFMQVVSKSFEV